MTVIRTFRCRETEKIFSRQISKKIPKDLHRVAYRKLLMLHAAMNLNDLRVPPGNRLEELRGHRQGQYSVRINDQWRLCFKWINNMAEEVEIIDYH